MPTPDEIEAAAATLRAFAVQSRPGGWPEAEIFSERRRVPRCVLAEAWLAEHPADDAAPIDGAWLESEGWYHRPEPREDEWLLNPGVNSVSLTSFGASDDPWWDCDWVQGEFRTRGQVRELRRLLAALGVTPAGGAS